MDDFIKRSDAQKVIETANSMVSRLLESTMKLCVTMDRIAAADVAPVRHGRWINICGDSESPRQCSDCLQDFDYIDGICYLVSGQRLPQYCPNCGAKMDSKDGDGDV